METIYYQSSACTDAGRAKKYNQDSIYLPKAENFIYGAVTDGFGEEPNGSEASHLVTQHIKAIFQGQQALVNLNDAVVGQLLIQALNTANQHIIEHLRDGGSTVTAVCVHDLRATIAHVGDSRAYLIDARKNQGIQLTADHTVMMPLIALDDWRPQDPTPKLVLYRALGQIEHIEIDLLNTDLQIGDRLLLCTDGLYRYVSDEEMAAIALAEKNPDDATQKLIDLANERGGEDNISVVIITIQANALD